MMEFDRHYRRVYARLHRMANYLLRDSDAAHDAACMVILKKMEEFGSNWVVDPISENELIKAIYSEWRREQRRQKVHFRPSTMITPEMDATEEDALDWLVGGASPQQEKICDANQMSARMSALPERHRKIMGMLCEGMSPMEISADTRLALDTVLYLIRDGRSMIADDKLALPDEIKEYRKQRDTTAYGGVG